MSKRYRLKKDLPNVQAGAIYQKSEFNRNLYWYGWPVSGSLPEADQVGISEFEARHVENNPEWFEEVVDRIEVVDIYTYAEDDRIRVLFNRGIKHEKIKAIKQAIEFVVNYNEHPLKDSSGNNLYTQSHLEDAFNAGRVMSVVRYGVHKYSDFQDYLKSIQP